MSDSDDRTEAVGALRGGLRERRPRGGRRWRLWGLGVNSWLIVLRAFGAHQLDQH
jgi:hypothetical protein